MTPKDCPKFIKCSAPICPLDADWRKRVLFNEDPTCFYLMQSVKKDAEAAFKVAGLEVLYLEMKRAYQPLTSTRQPLKNALAVAMLSGLRMTRIIPRAIKPEEGGGHE